jgi:hypothetical protein
MAPNLAVSTYELTQNIINSKLQGGVGVQNEEGEFERNLRRVWDLGRSEILRELLEKEGRVQWMEIMRKCIVEGVKLGEHAGKPPLYSNLEDRIR